MARKGVTTLHIEQKCSRLKITHLAYADDLLIFARGDVTSVTLIMNCLHTFGNTAGLHINLHKSNVYLASVDEYTRQEIRNITGFTTGSLPFRYLGIPLASTKLRTTDYSSLVDAIQKKISSWPRQTLSYARKVELIRSVVQWVECYWLPVYQCRRILLTRFMLFAGSLSGRQSIHLLLGVCFANQ